MPYNSLANAPEAGEGSHRRPATRADRQLRKDKATGLFYPEDRARLGSLSSQIAELQRSIEVRSRDESCQWQADVNRKL